MAQSFYSQVDNFKDISHVKFASIEQYRNFVHELKRHYNKVSPEKWPTELNLRGTVKLHGTHADIVYTRCQDEDGKPCYRVHYQSRNRVLSIGYDNCGFAKFMENLPIHVKENLFLKATKHAQDEVSELMIAGEFCGSNVQKGIALTRLPLMFVIFAIQINGNWTDITMHADVEDPPSRIYNICRGGVYRLKMDINDSEEVVSRLSTITSEVERECPFAKSLGISGIGEGVVWVCEEHCNQVKYWFKVKGDEHSVSKVKTLKTLSEKERAQLKDIAEFVKQAVQEARLRQGFDYLREMNLPEDIKSIGSYIKWVVEDVLKEEKDTIEELKLDVCRVKKAITVLAGGFYKEQIKKPKICTLQEEMSGDRV